MALDINSNKYAFAFSTVMVVVVAVLLALASEGLKPMQSANVRIEKMQNVLSSVGVKTTALQADSAYTALIKESYVLDVEGNIKDAPSQEAFEIDVLAQYKDKEKPDKYKEYPLSLFVLEMESVLILYQWLALDFGGQYGDIWRFLVMVSQ